MWQDLTENKTLLVAVGGGIVTTFLRTFLLFYLPSALSFTNDYAPYTAIYIPRFNDRAFYQAPITWEWGLVAGMTIAFVIWCELWKLIRKPLYKRWDYGLVKVDVAGEGGAGTEAKVAGGSVDEKKKRGA
jgi:P-type Na+/K+ transporter